MRTDHKPLVGSVTKKADSALLIPRRHLLKIAQFVDRLHYMKGQQNGVSDALSRVLLQPKVVTAMSAIDNWSLTLDYQSLSDTLPIEGSPGAIKEDALVDQTFLLRHKRQRDMQRIQLPAPTFETASSPLNTQSTNALQIDQSLTTIHACSAIFTPRSSRLVKLPPGGEVRAAQDNDEPLQKWINHHRTSTSRFDPDLVEFVDGARVWADISTTPARVLVPTTLQRTVFDNIHCLAHPGVKAGLALIKRPYWWQGMSKDVARWTKSCDACQKSKVHVHTRMPLERLPAPTKRFNHLHIDLVGPLNLACEGKNMLLTIIDRWTGWPEAFPMTMHGDATNAKACAKVLVHDWIARWGVPDVITSDRAAQFVSDLWLEICSLMGISRDTTTSYHPQHNGKVERMHRCLKNSLRTRLLGRANWLSELPWVMLGLRAAANLDTGVSPSMLVTGQQPALPAHLATQRADIDDASTFGRQLSSAMAAQSFNENPWHDKRRIRSHIPRDLMTPEQVLVRATKFSHRLCRNTLVRIGFFAVGANVFASKWRIARTPSQWTDCVRSTRMRLIAVNQTTLSPTLQKST